MDRRNEVVEQLRGTIMSVDPLQMEQLVQAILGAREVFCHGIGRSGLSSRAFAMRLMHIGIPVSIVGDTLAHCIQKDDLLILTSASGSSSSLYFIAKKAKDAGAKVALVTSTESSKIAEIADHLLYLKAPSKYASYSAMKSILPMGSLFEEGAYVLYDILVVELMERLKLTNDIVLKRHANLE